MKLLGQNIKPSTWRLVAVLAVFFTFCAGLVWREGFFAVMAAAGRLPALPKVADEGAMVESQIDDTEWKQAMQKEVSIALNLIGTLVLSLPLVLRKELYVGLLASH